MIRQIFLAAAVSVCAMLASPVNAQLAPQTVTLMKVDPVNAGHRLPLIKDRWQLGR
jgi:hypothetical protein